ncbi:MAG: hypothetical protein ACLQUY_07700 [Ktedonobacterales bacterium]
MAQTQDQKPAGAATPNGGEPKSFLSRFTRPWTDKADSSKGSSQSAQPARSQSRLGKLMFGWLILLLVVEFATTGLQFLNVKFNLGLTVPWFHTSALLIGGINSFYAINLLIIVGAYYVLVRFNMIPRDLFSSSRATSARSQVAAPSQPGKPSPDGMGKVRRTRAARRHSTTAVTAANPHSTTRRSTTKTRTATPRTSPPAPTGHDEEYYQVKEAQRQLRRREAKH